MKEYFEDRDFHEIIIKHIESAESTVCQNDKKDDVFLLSLPYCFCWEFSKLALFLFIYSDTLIGQFYRDHSTV